MSFYHDFAQPAMIALARAGNRGCLIDTALRDRLVVAEQAKLTQTVAELREILGRELNPNSPKQVKELLYDELRLPEQRKRAVGGKGKGTVTADEEAIKKLRRIVPQHAPLLNHLVSYRGSVKRISTLRTTLDVRSDGLSYYVTSYNATGTATGRISSSAHLSGKGGNLQNQERGASRRMFTARPGMVFVKADGSQAEARVVAALAQDTAWLERFADLGYDVHTENAGFVYSCEQSLVVEEHKIKSPAERVEWFKTHPQLPLGSPPYVDSMRQRSKPVTHGANYMGGPQVAVKMADIPFAEAKVGLQRYLRHRPRLQWWWDKVDEMLHTTRRIKTFWGRQRLFLGRADKSTLRAAVAHEPQSTVGDLINHAFFHLDEELLAVGGYPLLQAHDEIVAEVPKGQEEPTAALLRHFLEWPMTFPEVGELRIPADVSVGVNWYDLEKVGAAG